MSRSGYISVIPVRSEDAVSVEVAYPLGVISNFGGGNPLDLILWRINPQVIKIEEDGESLKPFSRGGNRGLGRSIIASINILLWMNYYS